MLHCTYSCSPDSVSGTVPKLTDQQETRYSETGLEGGKVLRYSPNIHRTGMFHVVTIQRSSESRQLLAGRLVIFVGNEFPNL